MQFSAAAMMFIWHLRMWGFTCKQREKQINLEISANVCIFVLRL